MYSDMNSWRWSFGYEPLGNMRKWDLGEPNNRWGDQNCAAMTPWGWWDLECDEMLPFVCFDGKFSYISLSNCVSRVFWIWTVSSACRRHFKRHCIMSCCVILCISCYKVSVSNVTLRNTSEGFVYVTYTPFSFFCKAWLFTFIICFLAETKTGNDRYIYISNDADFYAAQAYCRQHHTDLASARDENENSVLVSLIYYKTWFGLLKDPWKWVDRTNFSYISWSYEKPNNVKWNENCGYLYMGEATDAWCSDIMPFFCYSGTLKYVALGLICIQIQAAF